METFKVIEKLGEDKYFCIYDEISLSLEQALHFKTSDVGFLKDKILEQEKFVENNKQTGIVVQVTNNQFNNDKYYYLSNDDDTLFGFLKKKKSDDKEDEKVLYLNKVNYYTLNNQLYILPQFYKYGNYFLFKQEGDNLFPTVIGFTEGYYYCYPYQNKFQGQVCIYKFKSISQIPHELLSLNYKSYNDFSNRRIDIIPFSTYEVEFAISLKEIDEKKLLSTTVPQKYKLDDCYMIKYFIVPEKNVIPIRKFTLAEIKSLLMNIHDGIYYPEVDSLLY